MKKLKITLLLLLAVAFLSAQKIHPLRKLQIAEMAVSQLYVDSVDDKKLVEEAIRGMLKSLDPHSAYTTAKETKSMNEPLTGSFDGIGVQFNMVEDTLLVIQPVRKGPSEKVGILAGDRIVSVNDTSIAGVKMDRADIMQRLRGPRGTKVKLGVNRRGVPDMLTFIVTRGKIPVHTLDAYYMLTPTVGYVRIGSFGATTYAEFMTAVDSLQKAGMHHLVLDLQDNGGGYLQAAVQIAGEFLKPNDLIVYTEGRAQSRHDFRADRGGRLTKGNVYVLINEYSASASEIVSGAIQDHDRGVLIGRRSFGKGLVQRPIEFDDGSMIRLTVAHYYTPSGRCIQKPYEKGDSEDYALDIEKRLKRGELYSADSIHFADSLRYATLNMHRTVYGGGGIMPDVFVPLDTTQFTALHRQLAARSLIINNILRYTDNNRQQLKERYSDFSDFVQHYQVPDALIDSIMTQAARQNVKPKDSLELQRTLPALCLQLKALVARDIWDMNEYYHVYNEQNHIVAKALQMAEAGTTLSDIRTLRTDDKSTAAHNNNGNAVAKKGKPAAAGKATKAKGKMVDKKAQTAGKPAKSADKHKPRKKPKKH